MRLRGAGRQTNGETRDRWFPETEEQVVVKMEKITEDQPQMKMS